MPLETLSRSLAVVLISRAECERLIGSSLEEIFLASRALDQQQSADSAATLACFAARQIGAWNLVRVEVEFGDVCARIEIDPDAFDVPEPLDFSILGGLTFEPAIVTVRVIVRDVEYALALGLDAAPEALTEPLVLEVTQCRVTAGDTQSHPDPIETTAQKGESNEHSGQAKD